MMKLSKGEAAILSVAALFLAFTAGWFARGNTSSDPIRVETQRTIEPSAAVIFLPPSPAAETTGPAGETTAPSETASAPSAAEGKININTATAAELQTLPGIGEKRAQTIIADREQNGPFRFPEDITRVSGIGEGTLANIIDQITTEESP